MFDMVSVVDFYFVPARWIIFELGALNTALFFVTAFERLTKLLYFVWFGSVELLSNTTCPNT